MKNSKTRGLSFLVLIIPVITLFSSCVKDQIDESTQQLTPSGETIDDLVVSAFFDWETTEELTVSIEGLPVDVGVSKKLTLLTGEGTEIYGGTHAMHEDFEMTFDLVSGVDEIVMKYGEAVKTAEVNNHTASFNFEVEREVDPLNFDFPELGAE
ncbi:hypothetical protein [Cyclobacterium marinum]|uniref:hypothetical protein n=1 Tax=Cyclobacterium marinum TaxID=104 RepID=UPI0030D9CA5A|tara:strand:- start:106419 stop:106880 length:462 start_codon:yes stop_codon:yes gene_type:complete